MSRKQDPIVRRFYEILTRGSFDDATTRAARKSRHWKASQQVIKAWLARGPVAEDAITGFADLRILITQALDRAAQGGTDRG